MTGLVTIETMASGAGGRYRCPDIPVEGPIVVHLGPTKREK